MTSSNTTSKRKEKYTERQRCFAAMALDLHRAGITGMALVFLSILFAGHRDVNVQYALPWLLKVLGAIYILIGLSYIGVFRYGPIESTKSKVATLLAVGIALIGFWYLRLGFRPIASLNSHDVALTIYFVLSMMVLTFTARQLASDILYEIERGLLIADFRSIRSNDK